MKKLLSKLNAKIVLATTTLVYREGNKRLDGSWMKRVRERNEAVLEIASKNGYAIDDLYAVSAQIPKDKRYIDGTHYLPDGYEIFANAVAECIKNNL